MADEYTEESYQPDGRADVDKRIAPGQQRPRKYKDRKLLRKKNDNGVFEYVVRVVSAEYDWRYHRWLYTVDDFEGKRISGTTKETDLTS
ncbi:MAG: hypothetical protein HETSPECPRED_004499 [Heterodermia speciosa]|uniref:Uncharacterized protein n=1 Tax=Heterodermia speciosa TaxID=116794 RepID=A0A8H3F8G2_9LECA|nr:MAG: hypothetical protein HETSPECPRED_004499 [Heterodermia speciosa]